MKCVCSRFTFVLIYEFNNAGIKKVTKKFRILAKTQKLNCKYLFCPPVFVKIDLLGDRTFKKGQF